MNTESSARAFSVHNAQGKKGGRRKEKSQSPVVDAKKKGKKKGKKNVRFEGLQYFVLLRRERRGERKRRRRQL